ncbi:MAG: hypothetical protein WCC86_06490 [Methanoregula sp.]|uniref:hypothetical protein n=1 Tax=Methanoregula sp. TaxID=2052170 RepID=UPI003BAF7FA4
MTPPPGSIPEKPIKNTLHHQVILAIIGIILLTAFLIIFIAAGFIGQNGTNTGSASNVFSPENGYTGLPGASEMPAAEITTKMVTCQINGLLRITGTVRSNVNHELYVEIVGIGYDDYGNERNSGYDSVAIDPMGTSTFDIHVIDGCMFGETGTYEVRIANINYRHYD